MNFQHIHDTPEDALLKWAHGNPAFDAYIGCNIYSIVYHYIKDLEAVAEKVKDADRFKRDAYLEITTLKRQVDYLNAECKRVYDPTKQFWDGEKDREIQELKEHNARLMKITDNLPYNV